MASFLKKIGSAAKSVGKGAIKVAAAPVKVTAKVSAAPFKLAAKVAPRPLARALGTASRLTPAALTLHAASKIMASKPSAKPAAPAGGFFAKAASALNPASPTARPAGKPATRFSRTPVQRPAASVFRGGPVAAARAVPAAAAAAAGGLLTSVFGPKVTAALNPAAATSASVAPASPPFLSVVRSAASGDGDDDSGYGQDDGGDGGDSSDYGAAIDSGGGDDAPDGDDDGDDGGDDGGDDVDDEEIAMDAMDGLGGLAGYASSGSSGSAIDQYHAGLAGVFEPGAGYGLGDWKSDLLSAGKDIGKQAATTAVNKTAGAISKKLSPKGPPVKYDIAPPAMSMGKKLVIGAAIGVPVIFLLTRRHAPA